MKWWMPLVSGAMGALLMIWGAIRYGASRERERQAIKTSNLLRELEEQKHADELRQQAAAAQSRLRLEAIDEEAEAEHARKPETAFDAEQEAKAMLADAIKDLK